MTHEANGNSSGKVNISVEDKGGWVRIFCTQAHDPAREIYFYLSLALTDWFRQHAHLRPRLAVPMNQNGDTVELHVWYEQPIFQPPPSAD